MPTEAGWQRQPTVDIGDMTAKTRSSSWLERWEPEDGQFWESKGKRIAWRTLPITMISLVLSFWTWFMMSAIVARLLQIGFRFDTMQLFWVAAMPGLAGGSFRIIHAFLIPIFGTRHVISISKLIPCVGICVWSVLLCNANWSRNHDLRLSDPTLPRNRSLLHRRNGDQLVVLHAQMVRKADLTHFLCCA